MKRLLIMLVLASMVLGLASIACAVDAEDPLSWFQVTVRKNGTQIVSDSSIFDLGSLGLWDVSYTGAATISPTGSGSATLTGNFPGEYIWNFAYSEDNSTWHDLTPLVGTFSTSGGISATREATVSDYGQINARYIRIQHDATLSTVGSAAMASGTAAMTVAAVPEPGAVLASLSLLASAEMLLRRRRRSK